ncbi:hypothetical protein F511_44689 [Dorcoceras hygrometricum]|uniref:Uncharacterized protein n=1 Tax=Dorcoceras hygrometricum TaxID=472368 RepID=A0A2Z7B3J1_9LAMI|nr:hypothetical protein F511_44689 [Dorcoceras hygrometricum]
MDSLRLVVASGSCDCIVCLVVVGILSASRKFSTVQDDWICEQQSRDLRYFPSFSVEDLSVFGGAGFLVNFFFDCYLFEAAGRPGRRSRKLLVSGRERCRALFGFEFQVTKLDRVEVQLVDPRIPESQFTYDMY